MGKVKKIRVKIEDLEIGKEYYVECGIWQTLATFVCFETKGNRTYLRFTIGELENWKNQFGLHATKSNFKVYEKLDIYAL